MYPGAGGRAQEEQQLQLPRDVTDILNNIASSSFRAEYVAGDRIDVPELCGLAGQYRFMPGCVIFRSCFEPLHKAIVAGLENADPTQFEATRRIHVQGPGGVGTSHALRYAVARLWHDRVVNGNKSCRVLYVPQWHMTCEVVLAFELRLCFYDDPSMLRRIFELTNYDTRFDDVAAGIRRLLASYSGKLIVVLDQVGDVTIRSHQLNMDDYFPRATKNIRVVFASSLYSEHDEGGASIKYPFTDTLSPVECVSMISALADTAQEPSQLLPGLKEKFKELPRDARQLNALLENDECRPVVAAESARRTCGDCHGNAVRFSAVADLRLLMETSGGIPLNITQMLTRGWCHNYDGDIEAVCDEFCRGRAGDVCMITQYRFAELQDSGVQREVSYFLSFLEDVVGQEIRDGYRDIADGLSMREIRNLKEFAHKYVLPLCPTTLHELSRFLLKVALVDGLRDTNVLVQQFEKSFARRMLSSASKNFIKANIFLARLGQLRDSNIHASSLSGYSNDIWFNFTEIQFVECFDFITAEALFDERLTGKAVLFIPCETREPFITAVIYNNRSKSIYAFQIVDPENQGPQHNLGFFTEASKHRWQALIRRSQCLQSWHLNMIWVLTGKESGRSHMADPVRDVSEYKIYYESFVRCNDPDRVRRSNRQRRQTAANK